MQNSQFYFAIFSSFLIDFLWINYKFLDIFINGNGHVHKSRNFPKEILGLPS